ncbi:unnamed protein product [Litomosoides sigmodontis]|uniref:Protein kinase domain-containing protein n=1 Tax=Litomosoides sigmodontis TaxID=42156 RepID=A0A3P6THM4_LITSI|nr:unnamed protein product [Litomosoides sigmodontis]
MAATSKTKTVVVERLEGSESLTTVTATSATESATSQESFECNDFSYCDDPKDAVIDETLMPMELRGKFWKTERTLGEGGNFKVYLVRSNDGLKYAVRLSRRQDRSTKCYRKSKERQIEAASYMEKHLKNVLFPRLFGVRLLTFRRRSLHPSFQALQLDELIGYHPNIVRLVGFRKVNLCTQRFVEYVSGGDLHDFMEARRTRKKHQVGIKEVRSLFSDLMRAVKHIHNLHIAHMDIKVENCLLTPSGSLKLTDFDEAVYFEPGKKMRGSVYATKAYAAPETFDKEYRPDCADMWACGIVLFFLLRRNVPWEVAK